MQQCIIHSASLFLCNCKQGLIPQVCRATLHAAMCYNNDEVKTRTRLKCKTSEWTSLATFLKASVIEAAVVGGMAA